MDGVITPQAIQIYRSTTFRTAPGRQLKSLEDAVEFIQQSGFAFFWPNKAVALPSLWTATAGDRPVADAHDDPGHVSWGWKDGLLGKGICYYGRVLCHRNAFISHDYLPYFYALSPNYGEPDLDYLEQYEQGLLTLESRSVYEALLREGPLDTLALRRASNLTSVTSESRFNRALSQLQGEFKVLPIGVAQVGAWRYAFIYDLTHRHYPGLIDQAQNITEAQARQTLTLQYFRLTGASQAQWLQRCFAWTPIQAGQCLQALENQGHIATGIQVEGMPGNWAVFSNLL